MNILKKQQNRNIAKQEHNYRMGDPMHDLGFNDTVRKIKNINKLVLLNNLMECAGVAGDDFMGILNLDKMIERSVAEGALTEFYTKPDLQNK